MGASFAVSNRFTAKDTVSKAFGRMGKGADKFGKKSITRAALIKTCDKKEADAPDDDNDGINSTQF